MTQGSRIGRILGREALLALLVLALVFLNFGHVAPSAGAAYQPASALSFCGDPLLPGDSGHAPCHVCRIGAGAGLPPPVAVVLPAALSVEPVLFAAVLTRAVAAHFEIITQPRAPPHV